MGLWNGVALENTHPFVSQIHVWTDASGPLAVEQLIPRLGSGYSFPELQGMVRS